MVGTVAVAMAGSSWTGRGARVSPDRARGYFVKRPGTVNRIALHREPGAPSREVVETVTGISLDGRAVDAHAFCLRDRADALQHDAGVDDREARTLVRIRAEQELVVVAAAEGEREPRFRRSHRAQASRQRQFAALDVGADARSPRTTWRGHPQVRPICRCRTVAMPRSATPSATRACGYWKRASSASRARPCADSRPCRMASPAAASPGVPLTHRSSPGRAPLRRSAWPAGTGLPVRPRP